MTYHWWVGSCNELTSSYLDPISKTPEFKYCAVNITKIENQDVAEQTVKDEYDKLKRKMKVER